MNYIKYLAQVTLHLRTLREGFAYIRVAYGKALPTSAFPSAFKPHKIY